MTLHKDFGQAPLAETDENKHENENEKGLNGRQEGYKCGIG